MQTVVKQPEVAVAYYTVKDVMGILGCKQTKAQDIIRQLNDEMEAKQFSPVESGKWQRITASVECFEAVDVALSNADNGQGALFFESCTGESWQSNNREYLYQIGNHRFYR